MPRRYGKYVLVLDASADRFNEAGAFAPEISDGSLVVRDVSSGFNEAGAFAPEIFVNPPRAKVSLWKLQ